MSQLFTTGWGALYLVVLLATMTPALFFREKRWLALYMIALFVCDRAAVAFIERSDNATSLYFLAWAYMLVTLGVVFTHRAVLVGVCLVLTSLAFIAGGFGVLSWDWTGTIQEVLGYIAMFAILLRPRGGSRRHVGLDDGAHDSGRRLAGVAHPARRQTRH